MTDKTRPDGAPAIPGCTDVEPVRSGLPRTFRCGREGIAEPVTALVYPVRVDAGTAAEFTRQVEALGGVGHPRVAPVLDAGLADGVPYVLTSVDAGTLSELTQQRPRSAAELADLGRDLASGLAAIHSAGLVHGGLSPDTVVLSSDGGYLLSGLTLGLEQHTGHTALSSPRQLYLAPETLRDGTTTQMSDLYALGAVLYTAASGRPPLAARMGETAGDHILRVLHEPPARLEALPDRLADLIARLLEKDPAGRPPDARTVADALADLAPEPPANPASAGPLPLVRPVIRRVANPSAPPTEPPATSGTPAPPPETPASTGTALGPPDAAGAAGAAEAGTEAAGGTDAAGADATPNRTPEPALPRPALMNRVRPPLEPAAAPSTDSDSGSVSQGVSRLHEHEPPAPPVRPSDDPPATQEPFDQQQQPVPARPPSHQPPYEQPSHRPPHEPPPHEPAVDEPAETNGRAREAEQRTPARGRPGSARRRGWLLAAGGLAVAASLIAVLAFASRQDQSTAAQPEPTRAAERSPDPTPQPTAALDVRLNPPVDHDTYVDLSWTGDPGLEYAVVIAQVGKPTDMKLVYDRTKYRVPVIPGVRYCFAVQATDGIETTEAEPWTISEAEREL